MNKRGICKHQKNLIIMQVGNNQGAVCQVCYEFCATFTVRAAWQKALAEESEQDGSNNGWTILSGFLPQER